MALGKEMRTSEARPPIMSSGTVIATSLRRAGEKCGVKRREYSTWNMDTNRDALTGMLDYEVEASKRYRRFVSLVMMHVKPTETAVPTDRWVGAMREDAFRSTDRLFPLDDAGTVAVLMGDTASQGALRAVERFQERYGGALTVHSSIASYPSDGLTPQDLYSVAQQRLELANESRPGTTVWRNEAGNYS